ncbi:MAG: hypothetical protein BBJ57_01375 [Desulfobacterales bacterium PC51MH44]|nr:MAG: hypothetical protein BBJ57_01375 [Desulfobacterales bacterium PC51MH44]
MTNRTKADKPSCQLPGEPRHPPGRRLALEPNLCNLRNLRIIFNLWILSAIIYVICGPSRKTTSHEGLITHSRNPLPGCIHHSDPGFQYASQDYVKELDLFGFQINDKRGN